MAEYIEREALLKHTHIGMTRVSDTDWQRGYWDGVDDMAEYIQEQPAADVAEVKRGKWIYIPHYNGFYDDAYMCGVCKGISVVKGNYCPNCGARMDGEGE